MLIPFHLILFLTALQLELNPCKQVANPTFAALAVFHPPFALISVRAATYPQGINDPGQVVGTMYDSNGNPHGFSYNAGVFKLIDYPGGIFTAVYGINNRGVIVGSYVDPFNFTPYGYNVIHAFQFLNGIFTTVDAPPFASESYAYGINKSGKMAGGYDNGDQSQNYAFFGLPGSFAPFTLPGTPPATDSQTFPEGLNDQNGVVVTTMNSVCLNTISRKPLSGTDRQRHGNR